MYETRSSSNSKRSRRTQSTQPGWMSGAQTTTSSWSMRTGGGVSLMSSKAEPLPKKLVASALALTVVVLGLGAAIVVLKLKPADLPTTAIERNVEEWRRETIANPESDDARVGLGL